MCAGLLLRSGFSNLSTITLPLLLYCLLRSAHLMLICTSSSLVLNIAGLVTYVVCLLLDPNS
jgi:hypothetical protein